MLERYPEEEQAEPLSLAKSAQALLEECRMVLPGIQALLGFQLTVVFSEGFGTKLTPTDQQVHFAAFMLVAIAVGLVMTPAAYHRQTGPRVVTAAFVRLSSRLLVASMVPLALGIALDVYVVGGVIISKPIAAVLALLLTGCFFGLWFVWPHLRRGAREERKAAAD
jgi:hypothetical protein